ncbi:SMR family transporter [Cocleimonas sp. KMM 6892]|uniref:DMT family transporter n=1 Tax=unclassified Cocleimonas TaxID=2639732 RepID=UPI002DBBA97A|nr:MULTISPECIES: SMR family transporter [unclassified Cocleimonas]MEB8431933.1 SMR family transporter [Cocleimonas sp. KMM 6892]MEC4714981.1 SMR family transporter [Cocleimonas sp. KMM 6895]MEC4744205.1 SMR family transporter [Cocleimonas sp. KMM 6896]
MKEFTYLFLALAVIAEVIATSSLKATEEFTKIVPTIVMIVAYLVSFYFMTLVLKFIPLGITYAIWSGVGIVLVTFVGAWKYKEIPDLPSILGMGLIISGVVVIHVFSKNINH